MPPLGQLRSPVSGQLPACIGGDCGLSPRTRIRAGTRVILARVISFASPGALFLQASTLTTSEG
jgi:hypothetical protein